MKNLSELNLSSYCATTNGEIFSLKCMRILKGAVTIHGYRFVSLRDDDGELHQNLKIHILIAKIFIPNPDNKPCVNHKDGNKLNNNVSNLEWCTYRENSIHAIETGLKPPPFLNIESKLPTVDQIKHDWKGKGKIRSEWSEDEIHNACKLLESGYRVCDVSSMTGLCRRNLQFLRDGERGLDVYTSQYDFSKISRKDQLSVEKIVDICKLLENEYSINETAKMLSVERKIISAIRNRKTHTEISCNYKF